MPAASSSRRSTHSRHSRSAAADEIEDPSSQPVDNDVADEEDDEEAQPRRRGAKSSSSHTKVKREKSVRPPASSAPEGGEDNAGDAPDDALEPADTEPFDPSQFENLPLDKHAPKVLYTLNGLSEDWKKMRTSFKDAAYGIANNVGAAMAESAEGDEAEKVLQQVDDVMKKLIDLDVEMEASQQAMLQLHQLVTQGQGVSDSAESYDQNVKETLNQFREQTSRQKYAKNDDYIAFRQAIWEVKEPNRPMPPASDFIPREDGDASDDEDDIQVGGVTQDFKCPITLTPLVHPMTSRLCGHSYSRDAIREMLKNHGRKPCPHSGCKQYITWDDLVEDKPLEKKIKVAARRAQRRHEEEESDGEVVD